MHARVEKSNSNKYLTKRSILFKRTSLQGVYYFLNILFRKLFSRFSIMDEEIFIRKANRTDCQAIRNMIQVNNNKVWYNRI